MTDPADRESPRPIHLNEWVRMFHDLYFPTQNLERSWGDIFIHLVEIAAALNKQIFRKRDREESYRNVVRLFAWFAALCDVAGVVDLQTAVFHKFPLVCPYCRQPSCECDRTKTVLSWDELAPIAEANLELAPTSLDEWQSALEVIYPQERSGEFSDLPAGSRDRRRKARRHLRVIMSRLLEELGEVAEAIRYRRLLPDTQNDEFADLFAWIIAAANTVHEVFPPAQRMSLASATWDRYSGYCPACYRRPCECWEPIKRGLIANIPLMSEADGG